MEKRILVVDDESDILEVLEILLTEEGFQVATCASARGILETIETFKPSLIIMDVFIGFEDGRQVCQFLKSNEATKDIPVIMLSAYSSLSDTIYEVGAEDFISKPFSIYTLIDHIQRQLAAA